MKKKVYENMLGCRTECRTCKRTVAPAFAADFTPKYTYSGDGMTFEKVSHANSPTETADGIVDYTATAVSPLMFQAVSADATVTAVNPTATHRLPMATGFTSTPCTAPWCQCHFEQRLR